ncbi:MAG: metal-dependent transcriptional regulator [Clostridia bacterium]
MVQLSASSQDYIEAILELTRESTRIRSVDIAEQLSVSRASVSRALGVLKSAGLIEQERYGDIALTELGELEARAVRERHTALRTFLVDMLGVPSDIAERDACRMEHCVSAETLQRLKNYIETNGNRG